MKKESQGLNFIVSVIVTVMVCVAVAVMGDFYFDLIDDVLMKDILSGAYTGTPAGHNIQMLYPISAFIALFYRAYRGLDWYGIFLCLCQFVCVFIIVHRVSGWFEERVYKLVAAFAMLLFVLGAVGAHFLFVQYTYTCGMLSATAAFLIASHTGKGKRDHIIAVVLIIIAYLLRSEMLLLTLPITGVAIFARWILGRSELEDYYSGDVQISRYGEKKALFRRYIALFAAIVIGILASQVVHRISYSSPEWKQFNELFDARTELYDFQYIPDYEENKEFFDSIGLSRAEQELLVNYNYGIDDEINADTLMAVAKYASKQKTDEVPLLKGLAGSMVLYLYRLRNIAFQKSYEYPMTDAPLNIIALALYLIVIVVLFMDREKGKKLVAIATIVLLFACRSSLWLFIIVRGRDPIRITHPLYLMEIFVLLGLILVESKDNKWYAMAPLIAMALISAVFIPNQYSVIKDEMAERAKMRQHYDALYDFFNENRDNYYFVDVYTSVSALDGGERSFSEKMFDRVDNRIANHDIMGGWASKSPLYYEKLEQYGLTSMQDALLLDNVYFVSKEAFDPAWLPEYYADKGIDVKLEETCRVTDAFVVYKLTKAD